MVRVDHTISQGSVQFEMLAGGPGRTVEPVTATGTMGKLIPFQARVSASGLGLVDPVNVYVSNAPRLNRAIVGFDTMLARNDSICFHWDTYTTDLLV